MFNESDFDVLDVHQEVTEWVRDVDFLYKGEKYDARVRHSIFDGYELIGGNLPDDIDDINESDFAGFLDELTWQMV